VAVPKFPVYSPYGATEAWIEFDAAQMTEYPRMIDGLYGSTSRSSGTSGAAASGAASIGFGDVASWAGDQAAGKLRKLPNTTISYFSGRIAAWYLFAAGALDSVSMSIDQGGASMEAMYKNAVKRAYEYAKMYDQGFVFDQLLGGAGGDSDAFKKGLADGLAWAAAYYKQAWGL
jgi:hypothetical protein